MLAGAQAAILDSETTHATYDQFLIYGIGTRAGSPGESGTKMSTSVTFHDEVMSYSCTGDFDPNELSPGLQYCIEVAADIPGETVVDETAIRSAILGLSPPAPGKKADIYSFSSEVVNVEVTASRTSPTAERDVTFIWILVTPP